MNVKKEYVIFVELMGKKTRKWVLEIIIINAGLSIIASSNPRQLMVIA